MTGRTHWTFAASNPYLYIFFQALVKTSSLVRFRIHEVSPLTHLKVINFPRTRYAFSTSSRHISSQQSTAAHAQYHLSQ